jgi:hypothetical protein
VTGRHGDLFDGFKLSLHALVNGGGACEAAGVPVGGRSADTHIGRAQNRMPMRPDNASDDSPSKLTC